MNICVVGCGYVGLVTGSCLAHLGHKVIAVDIDEDKIAALKSGRVPIYEPGLQELVAEEMNAGRLSFSTCLAQGVGESDVIFICVGTPPKETGEADMSQVEAVARGIGRCLNCGYKIIVNKSTVPVGSGDWVAMIISDGIAETGGCSHPGDGFEVVSNPEFLREGSAISDTMHPDRIVVGSSSKRAIEVLKELYTPILEQSFPYGDPCPATGRKPHWMETDLTSAEMIKYASNAFLATKISFINEVANICEKVGADVTQVAKGIGLDSRIGSKFLSAGLGWGGSCFRKDVMALAAIARDYCCTTHILDAALVVNDLQRVKVVQKLQDNLKMLKGKTVALLGLAFKPGTDDCRDAPALTVARRLLELGCKVKAYDPKASHNAKREVPCLITTEDPYEAVSDADAVVLATEWPELVNLDYGRVASLMRGSLVLDARNVLDRHLLQSHGLTVVGMGR